MKDAERDLKILEKLQKDDKVLEESIKKKLKENQEDLFKQMAETQ